MFIVDDNEDIRLALAALLEREGYATASADNGATALALLQEAAVDPCLILLDLNMPVMDGKAFREVQRHDPALAAVPVVIYSGMDQLGPIAQALDVPHYFQKPLNLNALVGLVHRYC